MKKILVLVLFSVSMACQQKQAEQIIDKNTYKSVLKEMILSNQVKQQTKNQDSLNNNWTLLIYKKYKIDSLKLKNTTNYYSNHPEELEKIYEEIYNDLKATSDSLEKLRPNSLPTTDKIKISKNLVK